MQSGQQAVWVGRTPLVAGRKDVLACAICPSEGGKVRKVW